MIGWLKKIGKTAWALRDLVKLFGIPGASTVLMAVEAIIKDPNRPNEDAYALLAAAVDNHERRLQVIEKRVGIDLKKDPLK